MSCRALPNAKGGHCASRLAVVPGGRAAFIERLSSHGMPRVESTSPAVDPAHLILLGESGYAGDTESGRLAGFAPLITLFPEAGGHLSPQGEKDYAWRPSMVLRSLPVLEAAVDRQRPPGYVKPNVRRFGAATRSKLK